MSNNQRQSVTGITVNQKLSVSKDYKRSLRQEIHYVLKYGADNVILFNNKTDYIENFNPQPEKYLQSLIGKTVYVLQIEPNNRWFSEASVALRKILH